jgi:hypothetical protein
MQDRRRAAELKHPGTLERAARASRKQLTIQFLPQKPARAYRVTKTVLRQYRVNFAVQPQDHDAEPIAVGGEALPGSLELVVSGTRLDWKRTFVLERLTDLMARLDAVTKRAQELAK